MVCNDWVFVEQLADTRSHVRYKGNPLFRLNLFCRVEENNELL